MYMGIIAKWKESYRLRLIRQVVQDFDTRQKRRDSNQALMAGLKGLKKGPDPRILNVAKLVKKLGILYM